MATQIQFIFSFLILMLPNFAFAFNSNTHVYNSTSSRKFDHSTLRFLVVGDWGSDKSHQKDDANAMGEWCDEHRCDFILSTGDNFYDHGVYSADDDRFQETWGDVYNHPSIAELTWTVIAGNHDHGNGADDGREWFEVEHSQLDPRWYFPDLSYSFKIATTATKVKFVGYDSESLRHDKNNPEEMLSFMDTELDDSDADWKFLFGHHPAYSCGNYAGSGTIRNEVVPLMKKHGVDFYLTGHEHNQEHWQTKDDPKQTDHMTIGNGGQSLKAFDKDHQDQMEGYGMDLQTFIEDYGFAYFYVTKDSVDVRFVACDLEVVYEYTRYK